MAQATISNGAQQYFVPADEVLALLTPHTKCQADLERLLTAAGLPETLFAHDTE